MRIPSVFTHRVLIGIVLITALLFGAASASLFPFGQGSIPAWALVAMTMVIALWVSRTNTVRNLKEALEDAGRKNTVLSTQKEKKSAEVESTRTAKLHAEDSKKIAELEDTKLAVLNLLEDIDREKRDASDARARMEAVISSIADGVVVVDDQLRIVMCNPAAEEMSGLAGTKYAGESWENLHTCENLDGTPLPTEQHPMQLAMASGKPVHKSLFLTRNGGKLPISVSSSPVFSQDRASGAVAVFRDITTEYQLDRAKSEFVSIASHQLRTPLTAINWYAESVADGDYGDLTKDQIEPVQAIRDSSKRMSKLINALLNVSRIETGNLRIAPVPSDLPEIVQEVLSETELQWKEKKLKIEFTPDKKLPQITADRNLVKIVLQNLLTNAIKYTPAGGKVTIDIRTEGKDIVSTVTDSGIGIPISSHSRIFQKLFRAENASKNAIDGTGLGLYVAKAIVEQSGGTIGFTSKENEGTTFRFSLPLVGVATKEGTHTLISDF